MSISSPGPFVRLRPNMTKCSGDEVVNISRPSQNNTDKSGSVYDKNLARRMTTPAVKQESSCISYSIKR